MKKYLIVYPVGNSSYGVYCLLFTVYCLLLTVNSCKKKEPDTDTQASTDNSIAEGEFSRMFIVTNSIAVNDSGVQKGSYIPPVPSNYCPDSWTDSADVADGFPITMWIQYGADTNYDGTFDYGCNTPGEKVRMGTVKAVFSAPWSQNGSNVTMDLIDYYVSGVKYEGTISVTKNSATSFTQTVTNGKAGNGSWTILWNCSRTLTVDIGDPSVPGDDFSLVSGTANGTDRNGKAFSVDITSPLRREMACRWIVSGAMTIKIDGKKDRSVDFGNGTCDDRATVTIDGNTFEFALQ
ncbi:MAG: hypothetical protein HY841_06075 [Bacteroidetes bacterium]|nr:hypothetical protein [Bacteroidota bacterium]